VLNIINTNYRKYPLPVELEGVYDDENYTKSINYHVEYDRLNLITSSFSFLLVISMFLFHGFAFVDEIARNISANPILLTLVFFGILFLISDLLSIPFEIYGTFIIEEKYGFNKTTSFIYITDKLKGYFIGAILGGGLLAIFIWFYYKSGHFFWIYIWLIITIFSILISMFYSNIIVPLFNKQKPLGEGELRNNITEFSNKIGFKLKNIYVIDGSKRSTKANAYFTGLGPKKRIVLYDTIINQLSNNEIIAVLSHEVGHYKKKHTVISLFTSIIQIGLTLYILSMFIDNPIFSKVLGINKPGIHIGLIVFGILYSPITLLIGLFMNLISRKNEFAADRYAASYGFSDDLINGLKKLSRNNLSNLNPHPLYTFFYYSHPTLFQRINALKDYKDNNTKKL